MAVSIGKVEEGELSELLALYRYLHPDEPSPPLDDTLQAHWQAILANPALHYVVARQADGELVGTCTLTLIPNLTRSLRPYGLIENVVTHPAHRKQGIGTALLQYALQIGWEANCYKVMLLTGSKNEATLRFYENAGFKRGEKTGFVARYPTT